MVSGERKKTILDAAYRGCPVAACAALANLTTGELEDLRVSDPTFDRQLQLAQLKAVAQLQEQLWYAATQPVDKENRIDWRAAEVILRTLPAWGKAIAETRRAARLPPESDEDIEAELKRLSD